MENNQPQSRRVPQVLRPSMSASKLGSDCIGVKHPMACSPPGILCIGWLLPIWRRLPHEIGGSHWFPASPSHADCGETLDGALDFEMDRYRLKYTEAGNSMNRYTSSRIEHVATDLYLSLIIGCSTRLSKIESVNNNAVKLAQLPATKSCGPKHQPPQSCQLDSRYSTEGCSSERPNS